jgi:hypothetical protein
MSKEIVRFLLATITKIEPQDLSDDCTVFAVWICLFYLFDINVS